MARMLPETLASRQEDSALSAAGRRLFEALETTLDDGWTVIHGCAIRPAGENVVADLLLLHRDRGIALLALGKTSSPAEDELAVETARAMLAEMGFARRFPGPLAIVALTLLPEETATAAQRLEHAFAAASATAIADPTWADWLIDRLAPRRGLAERAGLATAGSKPAAPPPPTAPVVAAPPSPPRLRGPERDDAWRVAAEAKVPPARAAGPLAADPALASEEAKARSSSWLGMALAACVVGAVLIGMAVLSHGNGPAPHPATVGTTQ